MRIAAAHLDYWRRKKATPRWAADWTTPELDIDNLINIHAGVTFTAGERLATATCAILCCAIHRRQDHQDLLEVLWELARAPGCVDRPRRRSGWCLKWAARILAQREAKYAVLQQHRQARGARRKLHLQRLARRRERYAAKKAAAAVTKVT